jgi:hypothetical protein
MDVAYGSIYAGMSAAVRVLKACAAAAPMGQESCVQSEAAGGAKFRGQAERQMYTSEAIWQLSGAKQRLICSI